MAGLCSPGSVFWSDALEWAPGVPMNYVEQVRACMSDAGFAIPLTPGWQFCPCRPPT